MNCRRWEHFQHVADMGVRGCGADLAEAFEQAALAMTAVVTDPELVTAVDPVQVSCEAPDPELLLLDWLNAVVYEMATRRMLFSRFRVSVAGDRLQATLVGEPVDAARHQPAVEVKGATVTELAVTRTDDGCYCAQCVVDV